MSVVTYVYLSIAILFVAVGQVLQKMAARQLDARLASGTGLFPLLESPYFWGAAVVMAAGLIAWLLSLATLDISKAYPLLGLSFVVTTAVSSVFLKERVRTWRWIGVCLISTGSAIMMMSS